MALFIVTWVVWFGVRYGIEIIRVRRAARAEETDWDQVIAGLRLRLPRGSELAVLEHQVWFFDDRNREAAKAVLLKNAFEISEAETYEKRTKYWLLAWRPAVLDNVKTEIGKVAGFVQSYGGRYSRIGLRS